MTFFFFLKKSSASSSKISSKITSKINRLHKPTVIGAKQAICDVNDLAKRLKSRLSNAAKNLFGSDPMDNKHPQEFVAMSPPPQQQQPSLPSQQQASPQQQQPTIKNALVIDTSLPAAINSLPTPETCTPPESDCASSSTSTTQSSSATVEMASTTTQPLLANVHWSEERKPMLRNLDLLKHYLTFISQEINSLDFEEEVIKLSFPSALSSSQQQQNETAKLAASLIEQHVLASTDTSLSDYHYSTITPYFKGKHFFLFLFLGGGIFFSLFFSLSFCLCLFVGVFFLYVYHVNLIFF